MASATKALMKGSLHTDELQAAVVRRDTGLRSARRISNCFVLDVPGHAEALIITDAAVNIAPTLRDKIDITQNAIDLAHALGAPEVRVAILSATATVNPDVPSTIDAAALWKMADRGQITGADAAGIVLGARVPIILTSRADSVIARLASCAVAALVAHARRASSAKSVG